jgi:hypothetical protein
MANAQKAGQDEKKSANFPALYRFLKPAAIQLIE